MTLEEIYYISQIVAVIAILASLVAVYWQVRQTNAIVSQTNVIARADLTHSVEFQTGQMLLSLYESQERADLMYRALSGTGPLSGAERLRVDTALAVLFGAHETAFNLLQRNLMEVSAYKGLEFGTRAYLRSPYAQGFWKGYRHDGMDARFRALLDEMVVANEAARAAKPASEEPRQ